MTLLLAFLSIYCGCWAALVLATAVCYDRKPVHVLSQQALRLPNHRAA